MSLRIACDLDGTLADMDSALQREARRLFGPDVDLHAAPAPPLQSAEDVESELTATEPEDDGLPVASAPAARPLTTPELRRLWAHVGETENFWTTLNEIEPGAVARLAAAAERHRWEILFLTQRPPSAGEIAQVQSQRWLQVHGFELPSVMVMSGSRGRVATALSLDAVLDDRPENCLDVATDSTAAPLLIWRRPPEEAPPGISRTAIHTLYSMADAIAWLEALTAERARRKTLVGRLRNAIGF